MIYVLIIVILFIIILVIRVYVMCPKLQPNDIRKFSDSILQMKTGDLVFMSGRLSGENFIKWYTEFEFSHVGLLLKEDDKIYIIDADAGQGHKSGTRVQLLSDKMKRYKGHKIFGWKQISHKLDNTKILQNLHKHIHKDLDTNLTAFAFPSIRNNSKNQNTIFCAELIAHILSDSGYLNLTKDCVQYSPKDFINIQLNTGYYNVLNYVDYENYV